MVNKILFLIILLSNSFLFSQKSEFYLKQGLSSLDRGNMDSVKFYFVKYLEFDTTNADVYYGLGRVEADTFLYGGFDEFNKAIRLNPKHARALMARGNYYSYTEKENEALKAQEEQNKPLEGESNEPKQQQ